MPSFGNDPTLRLGKDAKHGEQRATGRRAGADTLGMKVQVNVLGFDFAKVTAPNHSKTSVQPSYDLVLACVPPLRRRPFRASLTEDFYLL